jgi:hypothetical protein
MSVDEGAEVARVANRLRAESICDALRADPQSPTVSVLAEDAEWIRELVAAVASGEDVRARFTSPAVGGRPVAEDSFAVALHDAALRDRYGTSSAWPDVVLALAWRLSKKQIRDRVKDHGAAAASWLGAHGLLETFALVIELRRTFGDEIRARPIPDARSVLGTQPPR